MQQPRKLLTYFILLVFIIPIIFEVVIFNYSAVFGSRDLKKYPRIVVTQENCVLPNNSTVEDGKIVISSSSPARVKCEGLNVNVKNVAIRVSGISRMITGWISIKSLSHAYAYTNVARFTVNPISKYGYQGGLFRLYEPEIIKGIKIEFDGNIARNVIEKIVINEEEYFSFSLNRILLVAFVGLCIWFFWGFSRIEFNKNSLWQNLVYAGVIVFFFLVIGIILSEKNNGYVEDYPLKKNSESYPFYIQQFNALLHGQYHLIHSVDPNLLQLDNYYDVSERLFKRPFFAHDLILYKGKYYAFHGLSPIAVVFYPFYYLTNKIPTEPLACSFLSCLAILFILLFWREFVIAYIPRTSFTIFVGVGCILPIVANIFLNQVDGASYYVASTSTSAWLAATSYFAFRANRIKKSHILKMLLFALSGLAFGLLAHSRAHIVLVAMVFIAPIYLSVLLKGGQWKWRITYLVSFLLPAVCLILAALIRNYVFYDSIFQFGHAYQLSVYNQRHPSATPRIFLVAILEYVFHLPAFADYFPYFQISNDSELFVGRYIYQEPMAGIMSMPIFWVLFFGWSQFKEKKLKLTVIAAYIVSLAIIFIDLIYAGLLFRYVPDISLGLGFIAGLILLRLLNSVRSSGMNYKVIYRMAVFLCVITAYISVCFLFSSVNSWNMISADSTIFMRNLF